MRRLLAVLLCVCLCAGAAWAEKAGTADPETAVTLAVLVTDLADACLDPSEEASARISADLEALDDPLAQSVAEHWQETWLNPDYRMYMYGTDDPSLLPVTGRHAFVVLGFQLRNGEMTEELIGRCEAAAAAARAFPDSILVCTGGATGGNNPDRHTEAGRMKEYLTEHCGIEANRIFTDELAMTTTENAVNTLAILQEQQIEAMTVVTSDYHQLWGQTLFHAQAEKNRLAGGSPIRIIANYNWPAGSGSDIHGNGLLYTVFQLSEILGQP